MPTRKVLSLLMTAFLLTGLTACEEKTTTVERSGDMSEAHGSPEANVMGCRLCYNEVKTVMERLKGPNLGTPRTVKIHKCPDCRAEMKIYVNDDGVAMVKCPKCAPEGMPCDKCLPPKMN